nr:unnamed protein product [Spirometra erinaceieuropaei]
MHRLTESPKWSSALNSRRSCCSPVTLSSVSLLSTRLENLKRSSTEILVRANAPDSSRELSLLFFLNPISDRLTLQCAGPIGAASVSNVPPPTASNRPSGAGRGGGGFKTRCQTSATVGSSAPVASAAAIRPRSVPSNLPRRTAPVAPIAAVPPVLVVSSSVTHPLLNSKDHSDESEGQTDSAAAAVVKLPNSTWRKASELQGGICTSSDYFQLVSGFLHKKTCPDN